jgi:hypothetical protein
MSGGDEREAETAMIKCTGPGLPFITWLTRPEQPITTQKSLFDVGLLEELQIDVRGSCDVFGSQAVIHTGEIKSGLADGILWRCLHAAWRRRSLRAGGIHQLALASGVKIIAAYFVAGAKTFIVKVDLFRSATVADKHAGRQEMPGNDVHINAALRRPLGDAIVPLSAYEHFL